MKMELLDNTTLISENYFSVVVQSYFQVYLLYIHPVISFFGIISNSRVLLLFAFGHVQISRKTMVYYSLIGFSDLSIACINLIWLDLCEGLYFLTKGRLYFCVDIVSELGCTLCFLWCVVSVLFSNYTLVGLSNVLVIARRAPHSPYLIIFGKLY